MTCRETLPNSLVVSTDILGINCGNPQEVIDIYRQANFPENISLEVIPFPLAFSFLTALSKNGHQAQPLIAGIHGQVGTPQSIFKHPYGPKNYFKIVSCNRLIPSVQRLADLPESIATYQQSPLYLNVHHETYEQEGSSLSTFADKAKWCTLAIENGQGGKALKITENQIEQSRQNGTPIIGTLDIVHALLSFGGDLSFTSTQKLWPQVLNQLDKKTIYRQIHLPIGDFSNHDSLPIMTIIKSSPAMLSDLAAIITTYNQRVIIENQHGPLGPNRPQEISRLSRISDALYQSSIMHA